MFNNVRNRINTILTFKFDLSTGRDDKGIWYIDVSLTNDLKSSLADNSQINAIGFVNSNSDQINLKECEDGQTER